MATKTKAKTKPATKKNAKPTAKPVKAPTPTPPVVFPQLAAVIGRWLLELVKATGDVAAKDAMNVLGQALARGDAVEHQPLVWLRDEVNALIKTLRAADKKPLARRWSELNHGVRRLERAARPRQ